MYSGDIFELQHGKLNAELQFTAEGENLALEMELRSGERSHALVKTILDADREKQIEAGEMYRCSCGVAYYEHQREKHEWQRHGGRKPCLMISPYRHDTGLADGTPCPRCGAAMTNLLERKGTTR